MSDWTMTEGEETFPFVEDDNANITGYGHQDPAEFAAAVNRWDEVSNGAPTPQEEQFDAEWIGHYWVTIGEDGESLHPCEETTSGAIPVTALWGAR